MEFSRWSAENSQKVSFQKESKRQSAGVIHNVIIILSFKSVYRSSVKLLLELRIALYYYSKKVVISGLLNFPPEDVTSWIYVFNKQPSFTVKSPRLQLVKIDHVISVYLSLTNTAVHKKIIHLWLSFQKI